jgi:hypothetical protein
MLSRLGKASGVIVLFAGVVLARPETAGAMLPDACTAEEQALAACSLPSGQCDFQGGDYYCWVANGCIASMQGGERVITMTADCELNGPSQCPGTLPCG